MAALEQQNLENKIDYFRQLYQACGIKTTSDDAGADSEDSLDDEEVALRRRCRRFHGRSDTPVNVQPSQAHNSSARTPSRSSGHLAQDRPRGPHRRVVSAAPLQATTIKATPTSEYRRRENSRNLNPSTSFVAETPISVPDSVVGARRYLLRRSETTPLPLKRSRLAASAQEDSPSAGLPMKKRKRAAEVKLVPEKDRVFANLAFYYIPNDDIAPARRARITKAREYGACWARELEDATHVVVDKQLAYADIHGVLAGLPEAGDVAVVNEDFPLDCIKFRRVLNPRQLIYQVSGYPDKDQPPVPEKKDKDVLPLKPPPANSKRWDYLPNIGTPSPSPGPSQKAADARAALPVKPSQEAILISDDSLPSQVPFKEPNQDHPGAQSKREPKPDTIGDELSRYINMMQEYKALPLDDEHDEDLRSISGTTTGRLSSSSSENLSASEDERPHHPKRSPKKIALEERFACYQGGTRDAPSASPNARTIEVLQQMCSYYTRMNDQWRIMAYRKAIKTLQRQTRQIRTAEEARALPNVGERLALKIEEIVTTDRLRRLEYAHAEPLDGVLQLFLGIYDVGLAQANRWIAQGFRTLEDLRERGKLSRNQTVGIERYDDLNTRIPRTEIEELGAVVRAAAAKIDEGMELIIGGSYRRGAESSGDIDFIVTRKGTSSTAELTPFLARLARDLEEKGILVATLAASRTRSDGSKLHGCCVLPSQTPAVWRRVDFLLVPESEMGAALLYFTGNDIFNRSMRLLASRKGMRLNQRGLYEGVMRGPGREKVNGGRLVEGRDERRIFEVLGVKWREPWERWC